MNDQFQDVPAKIFSIVDQAPGKKILGVRLGVMLRVFFPNFSPFQHQCRNLREFIRTHVAGVVEAGRSGADVLYTVLNEPAPQPQPAISALEQGNVPPVEPVSLPISSYNWKAYSNPSHPFVVVANRDTGELQPVPENSKPTLPWIVVPKPSAEIHREIASDFVNTLPEPPRMTLARVLQDSKWYVHFSATANRSRVGQHWAGFRRTKLLARFKQSLRELGIPDVSPHAGKVSTPSPAPSIAPKLVRAATIGDESAFRDLVARLVAELPMSELRLLRLPVGIVFDAMKR